VRISDQELRERRLVFYGDDVERLERELDGFLELASARTALLIDCEGHLVTRRGEATEGSMESLSALAAGSFAATKEMARLLGENQFSTLFHQGQHANIQLTLVGDRTLFAILWDERTNLGMVRFYAQEAATRIGDILEGILDRGEVPGENLAQDYGDEAAQALDDLF